MYASLGNTMPGSVVASASTRRPRHRATSSTTSAKGSAPLGQSGGSPPLDSRYVNGDELAVIAVHLNGADLFDEHGAGTVAPISMRHLHHWDWRGHRDAARSAL